MTLAAC